MTAEEKLKKIEEWANSSHAWMPESRDYARGFKKGIGVAKEIVLDILSQNHS